MFVMNKNTFEMMIRKRWNGDVEEAGKIDT